MVRARRLCGWPPLPPPLSSWPSSEQLGVVGVWNDQLLLWWHIGLLAASLIGWLLVQLGQNADGNGLKFGVLLLFSPEKERG